MNFELLTFPCREMIKLSIHILHVSKMNPFMFAMECASTLHKCGCSSFDVETINNEFRI